MNARHNPLEDRPEPRPYMPSPEQFLHAAEQSSPAQPTTTPPLRPRRQRHWGRVLGWSFVVLLVALIVYAGMIASNVAKISTQPLDFTGLATDTTGRTNILILGVGDPGHSGEKLSDTLMVISVDTKANRVAQISLPRDLRVQIPGHGSGKINSANAYGGVDLAKQTVSNTLDIPIHYYVQTNFSGLRGLVDAVGGVDVDVKERLADPEYPCDDNQYKSCGLVIEPGLQHMDGTRALQYARCRKGTCGNDFGRAARQQEIIGLVRDKATHWEILVNPTRLTPLTMALRDGLQTDMGAVQMLQLALTWRQAEFNQPIHLVLHNGNGGYLRSSGTSDLVPLGGTFDAIQGRVHDIFTTPVQPGDTP